MADTKVETTNPIPTAADAVSGDTVPEQRKQTKRSPKAAKDSGEVLSAAVVEKEFHAFISKLQAKYPSNLLAYQVSNLYEGMELSVRIAKKTGERGSDFASTFSKDGRSNNRNQRHENPLTEEQREERRKKNEAKKANRPPRQNRFRREQEKENMNGADKSGEEKAKEEGLKEEKKAKEEGVKEEKKAENTEVPVAEKAAA